MTLWMKSVDDWAWRRHFEAFPMNGFPAQKYLLGAALFAFALPAAPAANDQRPNVLIFMTDDHSWLHMGYAGDPVVRTPHVDRLARQGVIFDHAYCSASSCAPSRAAMFTGRNFWELGSGANLHGAVDRRFTVFPEILREHGYHYAYTGKGYEPRTQVPDVQTFDVAGGDRVNMRRLSNDEMPFPNMNATPGHNFDYSGEFAKFLEGRPEGQPFAFFCGFHEPHVPYHNGSGEIMGLDPAKVRVPPYAVDNEFTRRYFLDYYYEIEYADQHVGRILQMLEERGELENTLIIFTSDNGIVMPRAKGSCYDWGTRMPFVAYWGNRIKGGRTVTDFINLADIAPTVLEACGLAVPEEMTARSFLPTLLADKDGRVDATRDRAFFGKEFHNPDEHFPMRAVRTDDFLYIHNFNPDVPVRWPDGNAPPTIDRSHPRFAERVADYPDLYLIARRDDPEVRKLYDLAYGPRPREELYDVKNDEWQLNNLADDPAYAEIKAGLQASLFDYLAETGDPRPAGQGDQFREYFEKLRPRNVR